MSVNSEEALGHGSRVARIDSVPGFYLKSVRRLSAYDLAIVGLFCCTIILSVTDLVTTSIALRAGLQEGNVMLLDIAATLKLGFFQAIAATKLAFIVGTGALSILGIRSNIQLTRKIVFSSLAIFVILLLFVSLNNLLMINF